MTDDIRREALAFAQSSRRRFVTCGDGRYVLELPDAAVTFDLDRVRRERHTLIGELVVRCDLPGALTVGDDTTPTLLSCDVNLSGLRARQDLAKELERRSKARELDWRGYVEDFAQRVIAADRAGDPAVRLRDVEPAGNAAVLDVHGWRLPAEHPAVLFGDGGSLKSLLALWVLGELATTHRVALVDWEMSAGEHRKRLGALFGDALPNVQYVRAERPLVQDVDRLRRIFREERLDYVVFDSIAYGCGGAPESAEVATEYFRALRALPGGKLVLAHVPKSLENGNQRPFGSAFVHNSARATWFVERSSESADGQTVTVGLFPRKNNMGALGRALGFCVDFVGDRVHVRRTDLTASPDFADRLPLWQRMRALLKTGPMTLASMAGELGAKVDTVERTARRHDRLFVRAPGVDGITRIALVERRPG